LNNLEGYYFDINFEKIKSTTSIKLTPEQKKILEENHPCKKELKIRDSISKHKINMLIPCPFTYNGSCNHYQYYKIYNRLHDHIVLVHKIQSELASEICEKLITASTKFFQSLNNNSFTTILLPKDEIKVVYNHFFQKETLPLNNQFNNISNSSEINNENIIIQENINSKENNEKNKESQIIEKETQIAEKEPQIVEKETQIVEKEPQIVEKNKKKRKRSTTKILCSICKTKTASLSCSMCKSCCSKKFHVCPNHYISHISDCNFDFANYHIYLMDFEYAEKYSILDHAIIELMDNKKIPNIFSNYESEGDITYSEISSGLVYPRNNSGWDCISSFFFLI
jgi:hypothetical protein